MSNTLRVADSADRGLEKSKLIGDLSAESLECLASIAQKMQFETGSTLFLQQDVGDAFYVIESGCVEISIVSDAGKKLSLNVMRPSDVFGEIAALDGGPRTATANALEPTSVWKFEQRQIHEAMRKRPEISIDLVKILCARLRWVSHQVEDLAMLNIEARLASKLLILHEKFSDENGCIHLSQGELADFLGATRESINKTLQAWRARELIELSRGAIWVKQSKLLAELAVAH